MAVRKLRRARLARVTGMALCAVAAAETLSAGGQRFHVIAAVGEPAPDTPEGTVFSTIRVFPRAVGDSNVTAFQGTVTGPWRTQPEGVWQFDSDQLHLVYRSGWQPPSFPEGGSFEIGLTDLAMLPDGRLALDVPFRMENELERGVWGVNGEVIENLLVEGQLIPDDPGERILGLLDVAGEIDGAFVLHAITTFGRGLYRLRDGELSTLVRNGWQPPGFEQGVTWRLIAYERVFAELGLGSVFENGDICFTAYLSGPGIDESNDKGIWIRRQSGEFEQILREGDSLLGGVIDSDSYFDIEPRSGSVGLSTLVRFGDGSSVQVIRCWRDGTYRTLLVEGQELPELGLGTTLQHVLAYYMFGDGDLFARIQARSQDGSVQEFAVEVRSGERLYSLRAGTRIPTSSHSTHVGSFDVLYQSVVPGSVAMAAAWVSPWGRAVWAIRVAGTGQAIDPTALLAVDRVGRLRVPILPGDLIETSAGSHRVINRIANFSLFPSGDLLAKVRTDAGDVLLRAEVDCPSLGCDYADVANNDCRVDISDLAMVLSHFGETAGPADQAPGDADLNGQVDISDLAEVLVAFGRDCSQGG